MYYFVRRKLLASNSIPIRKYTLKNCFTLSELVNY